MSIYPLTIIDTDENKKDTVIKDYDYNVRQMLNKQFDGARGVFINKGLYLPYPLGYPFLQQIVLEH